MGAKGGAMLLDLPGPARRRLDRRPPISTLVIFRLGGDDGGLRRALSPTFPAGELVFFIPLRVVAEEPGAAHFGLGGAMLLDPLGPALRLLTHVADFHFSDIAVRGDDGARTIGANDDAAAVELRGRRRQHP
jgi:hypothetical protein